MKTFFSAGKKGLFSGSKYYEKINLQKPIPENSPPWYNYALLNQQTAWFYKKNNLGRNILGTKGFSILYDYNEFLYSIWISEKNRKKQGQTVYRGDAIEK